MSPIELARPLAVVAICALLAACGSSSDTATESQPAAAGVAVSASVDDGSGRALSGSILRTEVQSGQVTVNATFLNPSDDALKIISKNNPMQLRTSSGAVLQSSEEEVGVPAHSKNDVEIHFAGESGDSDSATLSVNDKSYSSLGPKLAFNDVRLAPGKALTFTPPAGASTAVDDLLGTTPSGVSLLLRRVALVDNGVDISYLAVNGKDTEVTMGAASWDPITLTDSSGTKLFPVPPSANPKFTIPPHGRMTGTFHFVGRPADSADSLVLSINPKTGSATNDYSTTPQMTISNIPIPKPGAQP